MNRRIKAPSRPLFPAIPDRHMAILTLMNRLAGYVDSISPKRAAGWVSSSDQPSDTLRLLLMVNGAVVAHTAAGEIRADAVQAGYAGARKFHFDVQPHLAPGTNVIEVMFDQTRQLVPNGRQILSQGQAPSAQIGDYWSGVYSARHKPISRWWECDYIVRRINEKVCGHNIPGLSEGLHRLALHKFAGQAPFKKAVSVGCGLATKERRALRCGLVKHFYLYELSTSAIEKGMAAAQAEGLADRMTFALADPMQLALDMSFDLVYWNNSLHHMLDAHAAVAWSRRVLQPGGVFVMDDFVGPTRMQWSDRLIAVNATIRQALPRVYLLNPEDPSRSLPDVVCRPSVEAITALDPSECADSANIVPALRKYFPDVEITPTGGGVYHMALNDVVGHLVAAKDFSLLEKLMQLDDACTAFGEYHYAVASAVKS